MQLPGLILRWATLACWFLPFAFYMTNCVGNDYRSAFSKKEAYQNIADENKLALEAMQGDFDVVRILPSENKKAELDTLKEKIVRKLMSAWPEKKSKDDNSFWEKIFIRILLPNNYCLSGIGTLFEFKNTMGQILHSFALLINVFILSFWNVIRRKNKSGALLSIQLGIGLAALVNGLTLDVDLLFGFWIWLALLWAQVILEFTRPKEVQA